MKKIFLLLAVLTLIGSQVFAFSWFGKKGKKEVNVYTHRHYDTDQELFEEFTKETGIKVNVVQAKADELIKKLEMEGEDTPADVLITVDAARLYRAKEKGLLQSVKSSSLEKWIPENLKDKDNQWFGLTTRGRVIVYSLDRVNPKDLSTYEDLANPKWKGKILVRSSSNEYNQSLIASMIANNGEEATEKWIKGLVANFARDPKGNDRAQATAVVAGEGDIAIMNTYYMGKMLTSSNPEEVKVAKSVGVFFPNQNNRGAHVNISGAGVTKYSKNKENAVKFIEFLASKKAQGKFASANYEYPVNSEVEVSELVKSWGEFKADKLQLELLGKYNSKAVKIADKAGWK